MTQFDTLATSDFIGEIVASVVPPCIPSTDDVVVSTHAPTRHTRPIAVIAERLARIHHFPPLKDRETYSIGQLSTHLRVSLRTLRFYEEADLLHPVRVGVRRYYDRDDVQRLEVIVALREMEASLPAIRSLLERADTASDAGSVLAAVEGLLVAISAANRQRIVDLTRLNGRIARAVDHLHRHG